MRSTIERLESYGPASIVIDSKCAVSHDLRRSKDLEPDTAGRRVSARRRVLNASVARRIAVLGVASLIASPEIRAYGFAVNLRPHYSSMGRPSLLRHERNDGDRRDKVPVDPRAKNAKPLVPEAGEKMSNPRQPGNSWHRRGHGLDTAARSVARC